MVCVWVRWRSMNVWFGMQGGGVRSRSEVGLGGRISESSFGGVAKAHRLRPQPQVPQGSSGLG